MNILFVGDVFGQPGRDALLARLPGFVEERAVDFVIANGENAANGAGITSKIAAQAARRRRGRDHDRQPRLAADGGLHLPRRPTSASCGRPTTRRARPAAASPCAGRRRHRGGGHQPRSASCSWSAGMSPFRIVDGLVDEAADARGHDRRRPARRGDQREGGHGPLPRRPRDRRAGHAHARADRRRARAPRRAPPTSPTSA